MATKRKLQQLLFVDTNIWLDFYRAKNETGLSLLSHVEAIQEKVIATYQLESEFKSNRQTVIAEGIRELKTMPQVSRPGIFSNAKASQALTSQMKEADKRIKALRDKLSKVLEDPTKHDPVYKACQRIFHRHSPLVLTREDKVRHEIRRKAFRRFLHGCPPRKRSDVSIGDALNWEWMVHCAKTQNAELVIVTRDSDYGLQFDGNCYINDHLKQEFAERVSKNRKLLLYAKLSTALRHFKIPVTPEEEKVEAEIIGQASVFDVVHRMLYEYSPTISEQLNDNLIIISLWNRPPKNVEQSVNEFVHSRGYGIHWEIGKMTEAQRRGLAPVPPRG